MSDHDNPTPEGDDWAPCAAGELQRMVGRNRTARLNRTLTKAVSAGAICLVLVGGWVVTSQLGAGGNIAGISCDEVFAQLGQYADGTLDQAISNQITAHLRLCPKCGSVYEKMQKTGKPVAFNRHSCPDPTCRHCQPPEHPHVLLAGQPDRIDRTTVTLAMR